MQKEIESVRTGFLDQIKEIIEKARLDAVRSVDFHRVLMYWNIGRSIIEEEQQGKERAEYGKYLIKNLSKELEPEYGTGFSIRQLELCRQFYKEFPIASALRSQFNWTHYKLLLPLENNGKREYYIAEAVKNNWNSRHRFNSNKPILRDVLFSEKTESFPVFEDVERFFPEYEAAEREIADGNDRFDYQELE